MPSDLANLKTAYSQILERIVEVTASTQPTYSLDGQSFSRTEYLAQLATQAKEMLETIQILEPYWYTSVTL